MLSKIALFPILGKPAIMYGGLITLLFLLAAALIPYLSKKGKVSIKWHFRLARIGIALGILHAVLGMALFL